MTGGRGVDLDEARATLRVEPGAGWHEVRAAYRRLVRAHHPDVATTAGATAATARITEAYALLRRERTAPGAGDEASSPDASATPSQPDGKAPRSQADGRRVTRPDGETLLLDAPPGEAFLHLLQVAYEIGEVTYVDPDVGLLETIVEVPGAPVCSLLISLQWRAGGTEAFCTLETLGSGRPPSLASVVDVLEERLEAATA